MTSPTAEDQQPANRDRQGDIVLADAERYVGVDAPKAWLYPGAMGHSAVGAQVR